MIGSRPWLPLRQDLELIQGPLSHTGSPTWTLHDRTAHRYFRIGWLEFEILSRWGLGSPEAIAGAVSHDTPLEAVPADVERVAAFAGVHGLLADNSPEGSRRLAALKNLRRTSLWDLVSRRLIFFRVTLVHPDRFLTRTLFLGRLAFNRVTLWLLAAAALVGVYLVSRNFSQFRQDLQVLLTMEGWVLVGVSLTGIKLLHELGHAYMAKMLGCRVPAMGAAFLLFMPLFWTDVTEAWKLRKNRDRLRIDSAGLAVELAVASLATVLWVVLPPGVARTAAYVLATTTWVVSLTVNASPFLRFDGYYILSDLLDTPNLQERSFALALWRMRGLLLGLDDPPPESLPRGRAAFMIVFALCCWVYRFFLFWSIALLVYHFFFKSLGLVMMAVQVHQMMLKPVFKEVGVLYTRRTDIDPRAAALRLALAGVALALLLAVPLRTTVTGWGVLTRENLAFVYAARPAMAGAVLAEEGAQVRAGQPLVELSSPDLEWRMELARLRAQVLRHKLEAMTVDARLMREFSPTVRELEAADAEIASYEHARRELAPRAPVDGVLRDVPPWLVPGQWVAAGEVLGVVAGGPAQVEVYVPEEEALRLAPGARGRFYPESGGAPLGFVVEDVSRTAVRDLARQELSSLNGGPIETRRTDTGRVAPARALTKLTCALEDSVPAPGMALTGSAVVRARPVSLFSILWRNTLGILIRESGLAN